MSKVWLLLFYGISLTAFAIKEVPVEAYLLEGSGWTKEVVREEILKSNEIMNHCGLMVKQVGPVQIITHEHPKGAINLISTSEPEHRAEEVRLHESITSNQGQQAIRMIFVGQVLNLPSVLGVSRRTERHEKEVYENAVYITNQLGVNQADHTIAHELGHVLLNEGHYNQDPTPNIMHYQYPLQNRRFDATQCKKMLRSVLLQ